MRAKILTYGRYALFALLGLILFVFLWVQTGIGLPSLVSKVVSGTGLLGESSLHIGSLRGNLFRALTVNQISVSTPLNEELIDIDQLHVEYSFFQLLKGAVHLNEVLVDKPRLHFQQNEKGTWDITTLVPQNDKDTQQDKERTSSIYIKEFQVNQLDLTAASYHPVRDSIYQIQNVSIGLNEIHIGESLGLDVQTLTGAIRLPDRADSVAVNVQGLLSENVLSLQEIRLSSAESNVFGSGTLGLQWHDSLMSHTDFALRANPLSFDDIRIFVPGLAPDYKADFMLAVEGDGNKLDLTNTIDISDGASMRTEGTFSRLSESSHQLSLTSEAKRLNPYIFDVTNLPPGDINMQFATQLSGSTLETISGFTQASLLPSLWASFAIDTTSLAISWTDGAADLSFESGINQVDLELAGFVFPFASTPTYNVAGSIDQLDLALFTDSTQSSNIDVDFRVEGENFSLENGRINVYADLNPSRINLATITSGTIESTMQNNVILAEAQLNTREGGLDTQALIELTDPLSIKSLSAEVNNLNINQFLNNPTPSSISGTLNAEASLSDLPQADWALQLYDTVYDKYTVTSSTIEGTLEDGRIDVITETALYGGAINLAAIVQPFEEQILYEITEGSFSNLSIGRLIQNPSLESDLDGTFSLKGEGTNVATMRTEGNLNLANSKINTQYINQASIDFALQENTLASSLDVLMPASEIRFDARVDSLAGYPIISLDKGSVRNLDLGALIGDTSLTSSLNGQIALLASGNSVDNLFVDATVDILPSTFNKATIHESQASAYYQNGTGNIHADLRIDEGAVLLKMDTLALGERPVYSFAADVSSINLSHLINQDSLASVINASIQGRGQGSTLEDMSLEGRFSSSDTNYGEAQVNQADLDFTLQNGLLNVDQLRLESNILTLRGNGDVALSDNMDSIASFFTANGTLGDIGHLGPLIGAEALNAASGEFEITLSGPPGVLQFDSKIDVMSAVYNDYRIGVIDARIAGNLDEERRPSSVTVSGTADQFSLPGFAMDEIIYSATYADSTVRFSLDNIIDSDRNAQLRGTLSLYADSQYVAIQTVNLKLDEDQWRLQQPSTIALGTPLVVDNFHVAAEGTSNQFVRLDGILDVDGTQDAQLHINNLNIGTLASLFGSPGLDGTLNLEATLQGEASAPQLMGDLDLSIVSFDLPAGDLSIDLNYDSLRLNLDASLQHVSGDSLTINGYLPVDLRLSLPEESSTGTGISQNLAREGDVYIDIQSDSLVIGWILPFIDQNLVSRLDGALDSDIKIRGTGANPELAGEGRFLNGVIHSPLVGVTFRDINSELVLEDNTISFSNTSTRTGEGQFVVEGALRLQDLANAEIDIDMQANEFTVINTREYRSTLSGALNFTGTLSQPVLTGDIQLLNTDVFFENAASQDIADLNVQLSEEDLRMLENQFGVRPTARDTSTSDTYEALTIDIDIELGRDTWIRSRSNPEMNVQFNGELDFTKQPFGEQEIFGSIEVNPDRSYITQFGKRFEINQGTITFNGAVTDPILDFEALYEVPSRRSQDNAVTVFLDVDGTMETLNLSFRSDPTMEFTDMVSYVITGQPASEAFQLGGLANQSAESIAVSSGVGLLSNAIESLVQGSGLELDVIQIEPLNNARGATITAGKYVTPRIFTAVSQPIGAADADGSTMEQGTIVTLELELLESLLLRLLGGESVMEINLLWHYAY